MHSSNSISTIEQPKYELPNFVFKKSLLLFTCCISIYALINYNPVAQAQNLPGSVDPARLQRSTIVPEIKKKSADTFVYETQRQDLSSIPKVTEGFILKAVNIKGSSVFTKEELESLYSDAIGKKADFNTLQYIAARITQEYQNKGFFLSKAIIPQQEIDNGIAQIAIVEGYVSKVTLKGEDLDAIRAKDALDILGKVKNDITSMRPLHGPSLEQLLLRVNNFSGIDAKAVLEGLPPKEAIPGAVGIVIDIKQQKHNVALSADNFGSRFVGPVQLSGTAVSNNNIIAFDKVSISAMTSAQIDEFQVLALGYTVPLNTNGTTLDLRLGYSTLAPGYDLKSFDIESESYTGGIQIIQNILNSRKTVLDISAGIDFANITTEFLGSNLYKDKTRVARLGAQFTNVDQWYGTNNAAITLSQGLDFLGTRETGSANLSRLNGQSDFTKVAANASRAQQLNESWQAYAGISGQYSWDTLLSSEEFGYGGQSFGRAYDPSEITGDHGLAGALELRYTSLPQMAKTVFQPFGFYDMGKVWKPNAAINSKAMSGSSAGVGVRFLYDDSISGYFAIAVPLTRTPTASPGYSHNNGSRVLFQITKQF